MRVLYDLGYNGVMGSLYAFPTIPQYMDAFKGGEEFLLEGFYGVEEHSYEDDGSYADPDLRELVNEYRRREPGVPQSGLITSYNTMKILLEAIEAAQTVTDTDKVKHVLETGEWVNEFLPGDPVISFGEAGESNVPLTLRQRHMIWAPMAMNVYRGGKPQTIEVFSAAPIGPLPEHLVGPPVYTPSTPTATPTSAPTATPTVAVPSPTPGQGSVTSNIASFKLEDLVVPVGTEVVWVNQDGAPHTTTLGTPSELANIWTSGSLSKGDSFSATFIEPGTFPYFCKIHPSMTATVTVVESGS